MDVSYKEFAKINPVICSTKHWVEDNHFLSKVGITIPGKKDFPNGFVKLYPQDFIVEEIAECGTQYSIDKDLSDTNAVSEEGETVYATLVKYNLTTFEAESLLAEALSCEQSQIQHAGIKDLRAVTAQRISIRKVSLERVQQVAHPQFFLKDIVQGKGILTPGSLQGNRFTILIRTESNIHHPDSISTFTSQFEKVLWNGFYNFYYLQRFAAPRYNSPNWGKHVLLGEFELALRGMIIDTSPTEPDFFTKTRTDLSALWGNWSAMLVYIDQNVPSDQFQYEKVFLNHLNNNEGDFEGALRKEINHVRLCVYGFGALLHNQQLSFLVRSGKKIPETLPVIVSRDRDDLQTYKHLLQQQLAWPPKFEGLRSFREISRYSSRIKTRSEVNIESVDVIEQGITMRFTLKKGEYATTFLSHLFNLLGGALSEHQVDMNHADLITLPTATQQYFQAVIDDTKPE